MTNSGPIKWHGGKSYLAPKIIELMPPHLHYVEPYFGGGAVLLARDTSRDWLIDDAWKLQNGENVPAHLKGCSEVVNDINQNLTWFWRVLQSMDHFADFKRLADAVPFSEIEFDDARKRLRNNGFGGRLWTEVAIDFFVVARQSRQGIFGKDFATLTRRRTRGCRNEQANAWLGAVEGLPEVHERLQGVVILNDDAEKVIRQQDDDLTLFYCDPPYLHETRVTKSDYEYEMTREQHADLLLCLSEIEGKFLLSGYRSTLYDDWAEKAKWRRVDIKIPNQASSAKVKETKTECLWMNY